MMDFTKNIREWLQAIALGPVEAWEEKVAENFVLKMPFAPPGVASELRGPANALDALMARWKMKLSFAWRDVVIRRTDEPELYLTTARSEALLRSGVRYANNYVMLTRFEGAKIIEHIEYFNPLLVMQTLAR